MRPNFFVNTPDILPAFLQYGGPAAFKIRAALAATGSPSLGRLRGLRAVRARRRAARLGGVPRLREVPAPPARLGERPRRRAARWRPTSPCSTTSGAGTAHCSCSATSRCTAPTTTRSCASASARRADGADDTVIVVVNVDPHGTRETVVHLDMPALGYDWHETFVVVDEITGATWRWGERNYVRLDPFVEPAHILSVRRCLNR